MESGGVLIFFAGKVVTVINELSNLWIYALLTMSSVERLPGVQEVTGSIPVGDSDFFFVLRSCHVDQFTFHISLPS